MTKIRLLARSGSCKLASAFPLIRSWPTRTLIRRVMAAPREFVGKSASNGLS
jgi:hypothetical protein